MDQLSFITTAAYQLGKAIPFDGACWHTDDEADPRGFKRSVASALRLCYPENPSRGDG